MPEVLLRVVQAKKLLASGKVMTVQEAAEQTGISRSSFYKYKDDIFPFHEEAKGKQLHSLFRWMMSRGFCLMCFRRLRVFMATSLRFTRAFLLTELPHLP